MREKFKKLLSVMLVSTLLVANVIPVSASEIKPRDAAPALTQFYVYSVSSEKVEQKLFNVRGHLRRLVQHWITAGLGWKLKRLRLGMQKHAQPLLTALI